jgi:AraC-like DNA-binding protein
VRTKLQLFTADYITTIETALNNCQHEVLFVNTDFKLALLSNQCGIPQHHLTYYFNEITKVTFCEWRNGLRIAYAKELINQGVANRITLQALSLQCGFASQSTFIRAFRIITGESPSTYIKCRK